MVKKTTLYNSDNEKLYPRTSAECVGYGDGTVKDALDNTGVGDYPTFSESTAYSAGEVVNYQGKLYQFTSDHAAGAWNTSEVKKTNLKTIVEKSISELGKIGSLLYEKEQTGSVIFNGYVDSINANGLSDMKGKFVLFIIESNIDTLFIVAQRKGAETIKSEEGVFITNKYYLIELVDSYIDKLFTYPYGSVIDENDSFTFKSFLLSEADANIAKIAISNRDFLFNKTINLAQLTNNNGSIVQSVPFSESIQKNDIISFIVKSDNIDEGATITVVQRDGTTNKNDLQTISFNKEYTQKIVDDSVDRLFFSAAKNVNSDAIIDVKIEKVSKYNIRYSELNSKVEDNINTLSKSVENNTKNIADNTKNITDLTGVVNNLSIQQSSNVPKDFLQKQYAFGNNVSLNGIIGNECSLKIFGGIDTITQQGNNLLFMKDAEAKTSNGLSMSIADNIINVSGVPTAQVSYSLLRFKLNKGTYTFNASVEGDVSNTTWAGLCVRISKGGITELNGDAVTDNPIISSYGAKTYKVLADGTEIQLYIYCGRTTTINGTATIKVMINSGEGALPWEEPSQLRNINFGVKSPLTIHFGENDVVATISKNYGLAVIPVTPTATTESEQSIATYSNGDGDCYIADSIEYENGKLQYIQRIGKKVYSEEDVINEPYLSESSLGLSAGYNVYYVLEEPIVEDLSTTPQSLYDGEVISTDNENAYIYCTYNVAKDVSKQDISISRIFAKHYDCTNGIESSVIDNDNIYIGSWEGDISKIDISNIFNPSVKRLQNNNGYIVRELLISDNYLFAICRDPTSATGETEGLEYGKGLLQVIDKSTLEVKKNIKLKNKGTGGKIYGDYLYVMEQMWDMAVYSLKVLKDDGILEENVKPIFQLNLDKLAGYAVQWTLGEYQRIDFWYNEAEKKHYAIISAFDGGIHLFDVTNLVTMPSSATNDTEQGTFGTNQDWATFTNAREITRIGGVIPNFDTGTTNNQVFDVVVNFPYAYITSAPKDSAFKYAKDVVRGIVTIDVSDMSKFKVLADAGNEQSYQWNRLVNFPEGTIVDICNIPYKGWSPHISEGDLHPSRIKKIGDAIITNNGKKGIALYRVKNGIPKFDKNISLNGWIFTALSLSDNNSVIAVPYQGGGDSSKNRLTTLFNIGNVNY